MNRILYLSAALLLAGCGRAFAPWEPTSAAQMYRQETYEIDFGGGETAGKLVLILEPPVPDRPVEGYDVAFDDREPVRVFKHSRVAVRMPAGPHTVTVAAAGFGLPATERFSITAGDGIELIFTGPSSELAGGSFRYGAGLD